MASTVWITAVLFLVANLYGSIAQQAATINITILEEAVKEGAVCLDGSPPAYYFRRGGTQNWLLFMQGGGVCYGESKQERSCFNRSTTYLGSSAQMPNQITLDFGAFSISKERNPDFWNWNHVYINYCDGGCFAGDVQEPVPVITSTSTNETRYLYYRGRRIWSYVMNNLLEQGMKDANKIVLSGCSAGAIATAIFCNDFKQLVGPQTSVKCWMDGGLFIDLPDRTGGYYLRPIFETVVQEHNITIGVERKYVPSSATYQQLFPPYYLLSIKAPLFLLNAAYDTWQIRNTLQYPTAEWRTCVENSTTCQPNQLQILQGFRSNFFKALEPSLRLQNKDWATFINSCFHHCQGDVSTVKIENQVHLPFKITIKLCCIEQTILNVFGDWACDRKVAKVIDWLPWPSNPTCTTYFEDSWL